MPVLTNKKQERFAIELAKRTPQGQAYELAGYKRNDAHASRLAKDGKIMARVAELQERVTAKVVERVTINRIWVLDMLRENLERALQHKAVLDTEGNPTGEYRYEGNVANRALELIGKELGMFIDRKEIRHTTDLDTMSDHELVATLARETRLLLEDHSRDDETELE